MAIDFDIDLYEPEIVQNPWSTVKALQEAGPVLRNVRTGDWMVTTDRLARTVLTDTTRFTIERNITSAERFGTEAFYVVDDKARHDQLRSIWMNAFARKTLEALRPTITELADQMIDPIEARLRAGEVVDLERELCRNLPAYVIAYMMGMPKRYRDDVVRWGDELGAAAVLPSDTSRDTHPTWIQATKARSEIGAYLAEAIADRRRDPGTDLISQMVHSPYNLSDDVIIANSRQMLGPETTAKWLGHIVVALAEHPDVRAELIADPTLIPVAMEEVMRWRPVVMASVRSVRGGSADIDGVMVPEGSNIMAMVCCANRDPVRYDDPNTFNIHRTLQINLGFGLGKHSCLGMALARLESEIVIGRLLARIPNYMLAREVVYNAFVSRGPKVLPIALH